MDFLRLVPQALAALAIVAFFLLGALVIFGTLVACLRWHRPARRAAPGSRAGRPVARTQPEDPHVPVH
jgi:hypothetical protein